MGKRKPLPRAIAIYLAAIVAPALVLLYLGLQSVRRQQQAVETLAASNLTLSNEKVAAELERLSRQLAGECLRDPEKACPLALHRFSVEGSSVTSPRLYTHPPRAAGPMPTAFAEAEELEIRQNHPDQALESYRKAYDAALSREAKALALSRAARCLVKLRHADQAVQAWTALRDQYANVYDDSHRPYALIARLELNQLDGLYDDLVNNRWDLSAEQLEYYLGRLGRGLPATHRAAFARELDEHFRHAGPLRPDELYAFALPHYKLYYRLEAAPGRIHGLAINLDWVRDHLAHEARNRLGLPAISATGSRRSLWVYTGTTALVLLLLVLGVLFVARDVARDARINQLRADFVSSVSHELKTPLTLIRLYGETLLLGEDFPAAERRGFYQIITRESERLSHLIQKVLSFSRIERGEKEYTLERGDLRAAVEMTLEAYRQYLQRAGFEVEERLSASLPDVQFDKDAVSQAVVNLLDNAVKYSGTSKYVGIRLTESGGSVVFEVEDHGLGIPPEQRAKIFERFYRAPNGSGKGGYGLGLFLVRHIMDGHHGRVEVESESGAGSRFRLVFPAAA